MSEVLDEAKRLELPELRADASRTTQGFFEHLRFQVVRHESRALGGVIPPTAHMTKVLNK